MVWTPSLSTAAIMSVAHSAVSLVCCALHLGMQARCEREIESSTTLGGFATLQQQCSSTAQDCTLRRVGFGFRSVFQAVGEALKQLEDQLSAGNLYRGCHLHYFIDDLYSIICPLSWEQLFV